MEVLRTIVCLVLAQLYHNDFLPAELSVSVQSYMSFLWFLLISLACHVIRTKKPNIWRIMCRRWLISDKEVGSELINKPLSPSYCYCKNFLVYFWQINIIFCSTHESDLCSDFWQFKELCELHLWFKHCQNYRYPKYLFWHNGHRKFDQFMIIMWKVLVQRHVQQSKVLARDLQKPAYTYNTILASTCKHLLC